VYNTTVISHKNRRIDMTKKAGKIAAAALVIGIIVPPAVRHGKQI